MLLIIHNLPNYMRYTDVKSLLLSKCGVSEIILDNLRADTAGGDKKQVTVGLAEEGDAALIVRKLNGLFLDGAQLYVEDVRQKKEQPYRPSQELVQEMSHKQFPGYQDQPAYENIADTNPMAMNMAMMYNNMAMTGMYYNYMPMDPNTQGSYMNYGQQAPVAEQPIHSLDYVSNNARPIENPQSYMGRNPSPKPWDNQPNVPTDTGFNSRLPFFAQNSTADYNKSAPPNSDRHSGRNRSPKRGRPNERSQRRDYHDRSNRESRPNWEPNPDSFDLEPLRNVRPSRFDASPEPTNPNNFDIEPRRRSPQSRSYQDRNYADSQLGNPNKRPAGRGGDWSELQPKRMAAYPDRSSYPQDDDSKSRQRNSYSQDAQSNRSRDQTSHYNRFAEQGGSGFNQPPPKQGPSNVGGYNGPPAKRGEPAKPTPWANQGSASNTHATVDGVPRVKALNQSQTRRGQVASYIARQMITAVKPIGLNKDHKVFNKLKEFIRTRINVLLGDRLGVNLEDMQAMYRMKYPISDDRAFFFQVLEVVKNEPDPPKDANKGNIEATFASAMKPNIESKPRADFQPKPNFQGPKATGQFGPKFNAQGQNKAGQFGPKFNAQGQNQAGQFRPKFNAQGQKPAGQFGPKFNAQGQRPAGQFGPKFNAQGQRPAGQFGPKFNAQGQRPAGPFGPKFNAQGPKPSGKFGPKSKAPKPETAKSRKATQLQISRMEKQNPEIYTLEPLYQKPLFEQLDKINEIILSEVQTPDLDEERHICEKIAIDAASEIRSLLQLSVTKRIQNITTGLIVSAFGKVNKTALAEFLNQYGVTTLSQAKKGGMFVAHMPDFKSYDDICALGSAVIDGVLVRFKTLHLCGPPSKVTKQEIQSNRSRFIKSQIKPFLVQNNPQNNQNTVVKTEPAKANNPQNTVVTSEPTVKNNPQSNQNTIKREPTKKVENKTQNNANNLKHEQSEPKTAVEIDKAATVSDDKPIKDDINENTPDDKKLESNINSDDQKNDSTNEDYQNNDGDQNNDAIIDDQNNDENDEVNPELDPDNFDVDDLEVDENDLEDY